MRLVGRFAVVLVLVLALVLLAALIELWFPILDGLAGRVFLLCPLRGVVLLAYIAGCALRLSFYDRLV